MKSSQFIGTLAAALLISCSPPPSKMSAEELALIHKDLPGMTAACLEKLRVGGIEAFPYDTEDCFAMGQPRKWRGLWSSGFEWSRFCPEPAHSCDDRTPGDRVWLSTAKGFEGSLPQGSRDLELNIYRIEFIGRRTAYPGGYGHLGSSNHEILVDRVLSISPIKLDSRDVA